MVIQGWLLATDASEHNALLSIIKTYASDAMLGGGAGSAGVAWAAESGPRAGCPAAGSSAVPAATSGLTSTRMCSSTAMRPAIVSTHEVLAAERFSKANVHIDRCSASGCPHGAINRSWDGVPLQQCSGEPAEPSCTGECLLDQWPEASRHAVLRATGRGAAHRGAFWRRAAPW